MLGGPSFGGKRKSDSTSCKEAYGMYQAGKVSREKVLELNPTHPVFDTLKAVQAAGDTEKLAAYADILYNQARLIEGLPVEDAVAYTEAVCKLMK